VYAFEPVPATFELLKINAGDRANTRLYNLALSDHGGEQVMRIPQIGAVGEAGFQTTASLATAGTHELDLVAFDRVPVATDTLDNMLGDCARVDLIKCDVEGHEEAVLHGAARTIEACSPLVIVEILCESWPGGQVTAAPAYRFFIDRGYVAYQSLDGRLHPQARFVDLAEDFVFVPPSRARLVEPLLR
jgi:FkbM family methyltransferase